MIGQQRLNFLSMYDFPVRQAEINIDNLGSIEDRGRSASRYQCGNVALQRAVARLFCEQGADGRYRALAKRHTELGEMLENRSESAHRRGRDASALEPL